MNGIIYATIRSRIASVIFSAIGLLVALFIFLISYNEYNRTSPTPLPMTVATAAGKAESKPWVRLVDAQWQCQQYLAPLRDNSTFILLSDLSEKYILIADYSGIVDCSEVSSSSPVGVISPIHEKTLNKLVDAGLQIPQDLDVRSRVFYMCMYCGRGNAEMGLWVALVFAVIAISHYPLAEIVRQRANSQDPFTAKPHDILGTGIFLISIGVIVMYFGRGSNLGKIIPVPAIGLVIGIAGVILAFNMQNRRILKAFTNNNRQVIIQIWGEEFFRSKR
jgi:hypothetical protein